MTGDVPCPDGKKVLGGGTSSENFPPTSPQESYPLNETTWRVVSGGLGFPPTAGLEITVYVVCAAEGTFTPPPTTQPPTTEPPTTEPPTT